MGTGCDEAGKCYAAEQGKPEMCGRPISEQIPTGLREEFMEEVLAYILRESMIDADGNQAAGVGNALKRAWLAGFKTGQSIRAITH
jgi:hypothetical protein